MGSLLGITGVRFMTYNLGELTSCTLVGTRAIWQYHQALDDDVDLRNGADDVAASALMKSDEKHNTVIWIRQGHSLPVHNQHCLFSVYSSLQTDVC